MVSPSPAAPLQVFAPLPLRERLFVRARLSFAPLQELARRAPRGRIADIGCGHGLVTALLATDPTRVVVAIDPDERKLTLAHAGPGRLPNVMIRQGTVQDLARDEAGTFDGVVVADVLYLLPTREWPTFLSGCRRLLKPGGLLLLKEAEDDRSWKYWKCVLQEQLMVNVLGKTHGEGSIHFKPRAELAALLGDAGFRVEEVASLAAGYTTPHVLFVASAS
jgi:2-polyprenyl-6-hydroxyphenyl methylase/3-demethylubiquinone-9 3-methyltransferase